MPDFTTPIPTAIYNQFAKVDNFITSTLLPQDSVLDSTLSSNHSAGLDAIDVSPPQGKLLYMLTKMISAKHVLEVGTLGGYSAIWFARAVTPLGGSVTTCEIDPDTAEVARKNILNAGFSQTITVKVGPAAETLSSLSSLSPKPSYDVTFIDANKSQNLDYFQAALSMSHPGSLIIVDNVARRGRLANEDSVDEDIVGTRKLFEWIEKEEREGRGRVESTALQTVGSKGWDGFLIATVTK